MNLIVKEYLGILPFDCIKILVETDTKYGKQPLDLNVALAAVGQLASFSPRFPFFTFYLFLVGHFGLCSSRERESIGGGGGGGLDCDIFVYGTTLCRSSTSGSEKCLRYVVADGCRAWTRVECENVVVDDLKSGNKNFTKLTLSFCCLKILFPMLDRVRQLTNGASTFRNGNTSALGASNIMIHHSRDTEFKQWAETTVKTLSGVVKIFNSQRGTLIGLSELFELKTFQKTCVIFLESFLEDWTRLLKYIERTTASDNSEMSLAAVKNFQELLFGRQHHQGEGKEKIK